MWTLYVLPLLRFRRAKDLDTWNIFQANVGEFVWGLSNLLCLFTFRFNSTKSNIPRRVLKIVILIASGRIVQSHDYYKGKTRSRTKIPPLSRGRNFQDKYYKLLLLNNILSLNNCLIFLPRGRNFQDKYYKLLLLNNILSLNNCLIFSLEDENKFFLFLLE